MATSPVITPPSQDRQPQEVDPQSQPAPGAGEPAVAPDAAQQAGHPCKRCGAPLAAGQDWCMQCGAGAPGSVGSGAWRPWIIALGVTAVLLLGAAAAAYAAMSSEPKQAAVKTATVAQATPPPATTPVPTPAPVPTTPTAKVPPVATTPTTPAQAVTPPVSTPVTPAAPSGGTTDKNKASEQPPQKNQPEPILLDTDAASTYNPYAYPESGFGDPSLTIDGDASTGWSAQVNPATAPAMAEGVLLNLKSGQKLSALKLVTTTPGITLQVYGADVKTVPASITDKAWAPLSRSVTVKKKRARIALKNQTETYRFVTVWVSGAPASAVGTPEAPGKITLNEIELFPPT